MDEHESMMHSMFWKFYVFNQSFLNNMELIAKRSRNEISLELPDDLLNLIFNFVFDEPTFKFSRIRLVSQQWN